MRPTDLCQGMGSVTNFHVKRPISEVLYELALVAYIYPCKHKGHLSDVHMNSVPLCRAIRQ